MVQAQVVEQRRDSAGQLPDGGRHILGRQFLGTDLQHKGSFEFRVSRLCWFAGLLVCWFADLLTC